MNFEKAVNEVKDRLETVGERAEKVAKTSFQTLKQANEVVLSGVEGVVKTQTEAAKELFEAGKESFEKAKTAGLVAVASSPIEYLPDGRDTIVGAFNDTVDVVSKTGEKLVKVVVNGYEAAYAQIQGKTVRKAGAKKTARKTTKRTLETVQAAA
jgi:predicted SnoaL-like aldol condensation-catalyzing enzyme